MRDGGVVSQEQPWRKSSERHCLTRHVNANNESWAEILFLLSGTLTSNRLSSSIVVGTSLLSGVCFARNTRLGFNEFSAMSALVRLIGFTPNHDSAGSPPIVRCFAA